MLPNTLRNAPPHVGHSVNESSVNDCWTSRWRPHDLQAYSYVGIEPSFLQTAVLLVGTPQP
jgi:hypothetical protein